MLVLTGVRLPHGLQRGVILPFSVNVIGKLMCKLGKNGALTEHFQRILKMKAALLLCLRICVPSFCFQNISSLFIIVHNRFYWSSANSPPSFITFAIPASFLRL